MLEVRDILQALQGHHQAQVAIGLCFFAGLRPGECRAAKWQNYDGQRLFIEQSAWRKHVTAPKTKESMTDVPVVPVLRKLLRQLWEAEGKPTEGYILKGEKGGRPLSLDYLARDVIRPVLEAVNIEWHGYYAARRGLSTAILEKTGNVMGAARMLRHKNAATTIKHYAKLTKESGDSAANVLGQLYGAVEPKQLTAQNG